MGKKRNVPVNRERAIPNRMPSYLPAKNYSYIEDARTQSGELTLAVIPDIAGLKTDN